MGTSSRRPPRPAPSPASPPGLAEPRIYAFTPLRLFVGSLLLVGAGFAAGVLVQASLTSPAPGPATPPPVSSLSPPGAAPRPMPSFGELQAIEQLRTHLEHAPDDLEARIRLGNALFDAASYPEAIVQYQLALEARPGNADVRTDLGVAQRLIGRSDLAAQTFRRAIQDDPRHPNAHYNLGVVLAQDLGDPAGAIAAWERFLELSPGAANRDEVQQALRQLRGQSPP
jgi:hypothetical protein